MRAPVAGKTLCARHARQNAHGYVTGAIPQGKLRQFMAEERRRLKLLRDHEEVAAAARDGVQGKAVGARRPRQKRRWYTRAMMWEMARNLDTPERQAERGELPGVEDLTNAEYDECLEKVHRHYLANRPLRRSGARELLKSDVGPWSSAERGSEAGAEREKYNGEGGGRVFKWYRRQIYEDELMKMGVGREKESEAQCMRALRATSTRLQMQPATVRSLREYAGPQCFPQLEERERWRANMEDSVKPVLQRRWCVPLTRGRHSH